MSKIPQDEANYRRGDPINSCGTCVFFQGNITKACTKVDGEISHYGISDVFQPDQDNPFGRSLSPQQVQQIKQIAAGAADQGAPGGAPPSPQAPTQRPFFQ